ncbi:hypothetical protein PR002_g29064 [Phytophthora rubi]|uniref:Uncharacterized protein n=1 Tax=Phytophthora rubi TaxID=129364 RepID=A0A6A3H4L3_9STRA|nr:hypothetical protein PR002_g29064 [Phytophthora rubi]
MPPFTVAPQSAALRRGAPFADTLSNAVLPLVSPWSPRVVCPVPRNSEWGDERESACLNKLSGFRSGICQLLRLKNMDRDPDSASEIQIVQADDLDEYDADLA